MNLANQSRKKQLTSLDRNQIVQAIFADAESIGLRDRDKIEWLTTQVIERIEQSRPLPGMEHLVPKHRLQKRSPTDTEIQAMIKEILITTEPTKREEVPPEMKSTTIVKPKGQFTPSINLNDNALQGRRFSRP